MNIKSFLTRIWASIRSLFTNFPAQLKTAVHIGVTITENIKTVIDSPLVDVLTLIIPGELDDKLKQVLRVAIPGILTNLRLADNCDATNAQEVTKCAVKALNGLSEDIKAAFLHNISVLISQVAADGKLTWSDGVCILEWYYQHKFKESK